MSLDKQQYKKCIINPVLRDMKAYSKKASALIWGTICQESAKGRYVKQLGTTGDIGAFGFIQMELATANDILKNYIQYRPNLLELVDKYYNKNLSLKQNLMGNLQFQVLMCRCHYLRVPEPLPNTVKEQALYWKKYFNTSKGRGKPADYERNYL